MSDVKKYYHLAPCPSYDVETMESWLEDEAADGFYLTEDGFLFGMAVFTKDTPSKVRYRLEPKEVLDWSAESLFPNQEARALCEDYGWQYVTDRGKFFIYRSVDAETRELNTDPEIQAISLKPMWDHEKEKRRWALFWIVGYPLIRYLLGRETFLRMSIHMGTWLFLLGIGMGLWMYIRSEMRLQYVARLRRKLAAGYPLDRNKDWKAYRKRYWTGNILYTILILIWIGCALNGCTKELEHSNRIPIDEYGKELPFPNMAALVQHGLEIDLEGTEGSMVLDGAEEIPLVFEASDIYPGDMNYVEEKHDLLASTVIQMNQNGSVMLPDGRMYEAILNVEYYDTSADWIAKVLVWEYMQEAKNNKHFREYMLSQLPVDEARYFTAYFPTLVLRNGDVLLVAELVQMSEEYTLSVDQWSRVFAESLLINNRIIKGDHSVEEQMYSYRQVTQEEAKRIMFTEKNYVIIDARTEEEYKEGHIPGAICIPNETIGVEEISQLPDKDQLILIYCRSGNRSKQAASKLVNLGYTNIVEFGGIIDWTGEVVKGEY